MPDIRIEPPSGNSIKKRKRLNSASNPQLSETVHVKDCDTNGLFNEIRFERGNYFKDHQSSIPFHSNTNSSLFLNSATSCSNPQSSDDLDKRDSITPEDSLEENPEDSLEDPVDSLEGSEPVSSPILEFVSVDQYESPYLEESVCRISTFCLQNEDMSTIPEVSDEAFYIPCRNYGYVRTPLLGYTNRVEESTTLPPIYELEGEGSEITELPGSLRSDQFRSTEGLDCGPEKRDTHGHQPPIQMCHDYCAQYCSHNDSIMSYYSVVPPEESRESVRNVDHLVDKLDVKPIHGCPSPSSPFPLTPPNTCDSSPKLSNVKAPARNNLHALSGVEVKCSHVFRCCYSWLHLILCGREENNFFFFSSDIVSFLLMNLSSITDMTVLGRNTNTSALIHTYLEVILTLGLYWLG